MHVSKKLSSSALALMAALALAAPASAQVAGGGVSASFAPATGVLTVSGDDADNTILIGRGGGGKILVNDGAVTIQGGTPTINNTSLIQVAGQGGADRIILAEGVPGLPGVQVDGGDGLDTLEVNGGSINEAFTAAPNAGRVRLDRTVPTSGPYSVDIGSTENLVLDMAAGDDTFTGSNGLAALIQITVDGGPGNDELNGSDGADILIGGPGKDVIDGNRGNDVAFMGPGNDVFIWDPGDGSDVVEGQDGQDTLRFNGANVSERIDVSANGGRARFTRDVANITMDLDDVETIEFNALGGADTITVNDLSGTDVDDVTLELAGQLGGFDGDGQIDAVVVNGSNGDDNVRIARRNGNVVVSGLPATVTIGASEPTDTLTVNGLGGDDDFNVNLPGGDISLTVNP